MKEVAIPNEIIYVPGAPFYPQTGHRLTKDNKDVRPSLPEHNTMRLGFSYASPEIISEGIARLGELLTKELG
jgi:DNA-binding transcriptional MocR family regulator